MNVFLHYFSIKTKQDIPMIQTAINNFKSVGIIVASRPKMHAFTLGRDGGTVETGSPIRPYSQLQMDVFQRKQTDQFRSHMKQIMSIN